MSFSGGTFSINTAGQPVVTGTTISSSVFNALTADLATGLSTCMLKDGTQTATAGIGFYAGTVSLPGIYFGTDTATGFYRIGLNNNGYAVNGTKLLDMTGTTLAITSTVTANTIGVTSGTTATCFNTTATTVNAFGGASVALNVGHASGTNTILGASTFSQAMTLSSTLAVTGKVSQNGSGDAAAQSASFTHAGAAYSAAAMNQATAVRGVDIVGSTNDTTYATALQLTMFNATGRISQGYTSSQVGFMAFGLTNGSANIVECFRITSGGAVTINSASSRAVDGLRIGADSTNNLLDDALTGAGSATLYIGNASINVTSDENLKSDMKPIEDGLSIINALLPIEYDQDQDRPYGHIRHYMGFGARHTQKVAPWAVHTQGDTGLPWQLRQEFLMAPTVRAIQQLAERVAALEEK